ncbi:hypothetical protein HETIRDRAFT_428015 [Heterobasidion irregulare TC 32-1]|uniref:Uncharacterized protein n=1 Tax=Heterobasidion irregulare (strain TC 32-1) TaxID=747525 RepID=W4K295_HETIT|nr:uncharacterized protein HETIRDRAFT_428015 [Heterobasidion irregulare TC 32-1]ETW79470.1 hypothetical protein HETIRDRAFT_428015 [Heterobasidion irregulare TC 32-1]
MSGTSLSKDASTYGPYFFDEPTEMGHMYQVAQGFECLQWRYQAFGGRYLCLKEVTTQWDACSESSILANVAIHSTHDGLWHPASDDVVPPKFVRMERGNKQLPPESSSVAQTFDMSPRTHHRVVPPNRDAHAASSSWTLERSTEDFEGNAPDKEPRTQSTDCKDIPTIECDSVGVVASQKGHQGRRPKYSFGDAEGTVKEGTGAVPQEGMQHDVRVKLKKEPPRQNEQRSRFAGHIRILRRHVSTQHKGDEPRRRDDVEYDVESEDEYSEDEYSEDEERFEDEE